MDNCDSALDWKTVFKKILSGPEKSSSSSNEETNTNVNAQCQEKDRHENVTYIFSSKISSASCNNISEDNANQSPYFHELTLGKKSTSELFLKREQDKRNNTKVSHNFSYNGKSNQVPEWNKAFKNILGKNSSTAMENRNLISDPIKEQKNLQKCDTSVELHDRRSTSRKNIYKEQKKLRSNDTSVNTRSTPRENVYKIPKSKDPEEEEVKKLFALSRMFKHDYHNLNDFDGAGVDIFKCDKNSLSKSSKEQKNLQKCDTSVELPYRRSTSRKNIYEEQKKLRNNDTSVNTRSTPRENVYKIPTSKDPEEEEVKKLFALSRMFKHDYHNLNDFDGAGVDIFKCDKNSLSKSSKVDLTDKSLQYESDSESFVPVKGLVAKYIPYTTAELIASPKVPFIEPPWDDDLL